MKSSLSRPSPPAKERRSSGQLAPSRPAGEQPYPSNLHEVRETILRSKSLRGRQKGDLVSALNSVGRQLAGQSVRSDGMHLALIRTDPDQLDQLLRDLPDRATGINPASMRHTVSRARKAIRLAGVPLANGHGRHPLTADWEGVLKSNQLDEFTRTAVNGFACWCSARDIAPRGVDDDTFAAYQNDFDLLRDRNRDAKSGRQLFLKLLDTWNTVIAPSVGAASVAASRRYDRYAFPKDAWSKSLTAEIRAYESYAQKADTLDPDAPRSVSAVTARNEALLIRSIAAAYCRKNNLDPGSIKTISEFVSPKAALQVIALVRERAKKRSGKIPKRTEQTYAVALLIQKLARYWVGLEGRGMRVTPSELSQLGILAWRHSPTEPTGADTDKGRRLLNKPIDLSDRNKSILKRFLAPELRCRFRDLPKLIYAEYADRAVGDGGLGNLVTAFALQMLITAPARSGLVAAARVDRNIKDETIAGQRRVHIYWTESEVGFGKKLVYELRGDTLNMYDTYMTKVRSQHPGAVSPYLFPGRGDRPMSQAWWSRRLKQLCMKRLGVPLTAQQVGLVLAMLLISGPTGATERTVELARRFLGHKARRQTYPLVELIKNWHAGQKVDALFGDEKEDLAQKIHVGTLQYAR